MDESAEWRLKFDVAEERANKCTKELKRVCTFAITIHMFMKTSIIQSFEILLDLSVILEPN